MAIEHELIGLEALARDYENWMRDLMDILGLDPNDYATDGGEEDARQGVKRAVLSLMEERNDSRRKLTRIRRETW